MTEHLLAAAYLSRVAEPASVALWLFVVEHGYRAAAAAVRSGRVPAEVAACTEARRESADPHADLAAAERNDIRLITPADDEWPHFAFAALHIAARRRVAQWRAGYRSRPNRGELIPPLALWVRGGGDLRTVGTRSVAVVGSRAATPYGERIASDFAYGLARHDVVLVSGGAYGIDAAAHRGALAADGVSVLVSAGGLDRPYPSGNRTLYDRTADRGLLISERPPGSAPHRQRFLSRNRLIAALGAATLVVEAGQRSGALNSAGYARDLGRPVLAVPGPVTSAMSIGCHRLIQRDEQPAQLVTSVAEVLSFCGYPTGPADRGPAEVEADEVAVDQGGNGSSAVGPAETSGSMASPAGTSGLAINLVGASGSKISPTKASGVPTSPTMASGMPTSPTGIGASASDQRVGPPAAYDSLDPAARTVLDGFPARRAVTEAELSRLSGQPIQLVVGVLPVLVGLGLVRGSRDGYRLATASVAS